MPLVLNCSDYSQGLDHEISVVGYGETSDGTKYWIGRNSCKYPFQSLVLYVPIDRGHLLGRRRMV